MGGGWAYEEEEGEGGGGGLVEREMEGEIYFVVIYPSQIR